MSTSTNEPPYRPCPLCGSAMAPQRVDSLNTYKSFCENRECTLNNVLLTDEEHSKLSGHITMIAGEPIEIGQQVWGRFVLPFVRAIENQDQKEIVQFYCGILGSAFGSLCRDVGHENALGIMDELNTAFSGMGDKLPGSATQ